MRDGSRIREIMVSEKDGFLQVIALRAVDATIGTAVSLMKVTEEPIAASAAMWRGLIRVGSRIGPDRVHYAEVRFMILATGELPTVVGPIEVEGLNKGFSGATSEFVNATLHCPLISDDAALGWCKSGSLPCHKNSYISEADCHGYVVFSTKTEGDKSWAELRIFWDSKAAYDLSAAAVVIPFSDKEELIRALTPFDQFRTLHSAQRTVLLLNEEVSALLREANAVTQ